MVTISLHDGEEIDEDVVGLVDQCGAELILIPIQARGAWAGDWQQKVGWELSLRGEEELLKEKSLPATCRF